MKSSIVGLLLAAVMVSGRTSAETLGDVSGEKGERVFIEAVEGQTLNQAGFISLADGAVVEKTGKGTLNLSLGKVAKAGGFEMAVHDGKVVVDESSPSAVDVPTALLNRAAFWLDATQNVIEENGSVKEWRDRRETKTAATFDYFHAFPVSTSLATDTAKVVTDANGHTAVDFGGYGSGTYLSFANKSKTSGNADLISVRDVFVAYSVTRAGNGGSAAASGVGGWPYIFCRQGDAQVCEPSSADNTLNKYLFKVDSAVGDIRWWYNGLAIDATATKPQLGTTVLDFRYDDESVARQFGGMLYWSWTKSYKREGGDLVHEVLLFTEKLTDAEHARVRKYLLDRWNPGAASVSSTAFSIAEGATVEVENFSDGITFTGSGTVKKTGTEDTTLDYTVGKVNTLRLETPNDGTGAVVLRDDLPVVAAQGERLTSADVRYGARVSRTTAGVEAGTLVKDGAEKARLTDIPAGISKLKVEAGELEISPTLPSAIRAGSSLEASITNASFDIRLADSWYYRNMRTDSYLSPTIAGWTWEYLPGATFTDSYSVMGNTEINPGSDWYYCTTAANGTGYLAVRGQSQVSASVNVPVAGNYDLSFSYRRGYLSRVVRIVVLVGEDAEHLTEIGSTLTYACQTWARAVVRNARLAAGDQTIVFRFEHDTVSDMATAHLIDDIRLTLRGFEDGVYAIPNGSFERVVLNSVQSSASGDSSGAYSRPFGSDSQAVGWTLTQPSGASVDSVGLAIAGKDSNGKAYADGALMRDGRVQLLITKAGATASTTFAAPPGTWKLRGDVAAWRKYAQPDSFASNGKGAYATASVSVAEGEAESLGTVITPGVGGGTYDWDTAFTVPAGGASVTLTLSITSAGVGAIFDNLELVPAVSDPGNLITQGEFTSYNLWHADTSKKASGTALDRVRSVIAWLSSADHQLQCVPENYQGTTSGQCWLITDCGAVTYDIEFPSAGRYRLSYYTRSRHNGDSYDYGGNTLRSFYRAGGVTTVIDDVHVATTNWVAHNVTFNVREAGAAVFGFEGLNVPTSMAAADLPGYWDKSAYIDGVKLVRVGDIPDAELVLPQNLEIEVARGAKLRLDFAVTNSVQSVRLGGRRVSGLISAGTHPEYLIGEGAIYVEPKGMIMIYR